jgi:hypothetical protein
MHFTSAKLATGLRRVAFTTATVLLAGTALVAPATSAEAEEAFAITSVTGVPRYVTAPTTDLEIPVTVTISGPPADEHTQYYVQRSAPNVAGATMINTRVQHPGKLELEAPLTPTLGPGTFIFTLDLHTYADPGLYRLTIPILKRYSDPLASKFDSSTQVATVDFEVLANPVVTLDYSSLLYRGSYSKKSAWRWDYTGPEYIRGARLKIYYRADGKKAYKLIANKFLNSAGDAPSFKTKKGAIAKRGWVYIAITAVPWAGAFKTPAVHLAKR